MHGYSSGFRALIFLKKQEQLFRLVLTGLFGGQSRWIATKKGQKFKPKSLARVWRGRLFAKFDMYRWVASGLDSQRAGHGFILRRAEKQRVGADC